MGVPLFQACKHNAMPGDIYCNWHAADRKRQDAARSVLVHDWATLIEAPQRTQVRRRIAPKPPASKPPASASKPPASASKPETPRPDTIEIMKFDRIQPINLRR